jgi:Xaa-Pro aminopeptidase
MCRFLKGAILVIGLFSTSLFAQEFQRFLPPEEFQARRNKVFEKIGDKAVAVLQGAPEPGGYLYYRQTDAFYYLCGVENPHSYLLLDGRNRKTTLYLRSSRGRGWDRVLATSDADIARAKELTGVDEVRVSNDFNTIDANIIYVLFSPDEGNAQTRGDLRTMGRGITSDRWDGRISRQDNFIAIIEQRYPKAELSNLTPIIDELRSIKSPLEIELMRRAGQLAALGVVEAMRSTEPGVYEYQLEAPVKFIYQQNGAQLEGYRSILASGTKNISDSHYFFKSCQLKSGDLVLFDYAPEYGYYTSDIGRMWPVNGKYEPWQRQLLQLILDYHKEVIKRIKPGVTTRQIMADANEAMQPKIKATKFLKPEYERAVRTLVRQGGGIFSHTVGMAVHDVDVPRYASAPLKVGQVFAIDPQLRVPEENLYMRYEDTVVVTKDGCEVLTKLAPWELDDIEKLVREIGMVQKYPAPFKSLLDAPAQNPAKK